jgi:hypothetical protein
MSIDFPAAARSPMPEAPSFDSGDDLDAPSTWAEIAITVTVTTVAIVFVSFVAVVMGLA